jgi:tripartite-type tricarboxylate transporter receptor subunit TctC
MAGGDGLAATNFVFNTGTAQRITLGFLGRSFPVAQLMKNPAVHFDALKFEWIGSLGDDDDVLTVRADTGITSIEELLKTDKPIRFGGALKSAMLYMMPECLRRDNNAHFESIAGAGTTAATVMQALERGEIQGIWEKYQSLARRNPDWLKPNGFLRILARRGRMRNLPGVPLIEDYLSERSKRIVALADLGWGNPCCVAPGTSPEIVAILRQAFEAAVADPRLRELAAKQHAVVNPIRADQLKSIVEATLNTPPDVVRAFQSIAGLA